MTAPAALRMTYSDIKTVKTRSVYQVVLEGPLEEMEAAMQMLGAPNPKAERWVAVAVLKEGAAEVKGGKLAQRAGILCNEGGFQRFMDTNNAEDAAEAVRQHCGVTSRAHIDSSDGASRKFLDLVGDYDLWLRGVAA